MVVSAVLLAACSTPGGDPTAPAESAGQTPTQTAPAQTGPFEIGTVSRSLAVPWAMAALPDGNVLVTLRDAGTVALIEPQDRSAPAGTITGVVPGGEGGLLGIAVPPGQSARSVFVYYTAADDNRVARLSWDGTSLSQQRDIFTGIPKEQIHNGGRIAFGPDGYLYVATGDAGQRDLAQDPASLAGKILRITADGEPAADNPDPTSPVYSLGHRNVQGLAWDSAGRLWASEFGENDVDELNLIVAGGNYGWPMCEGPCERPGVINPKAIWSPTATASPSGMAISQGSAWVASLRGEVLYEIPLDGTDAGEPRAWFGSEYGRLRDVLARPGGRLWLATNNTDGRGEPRETDDRVIAVELPRAE